ncbi:AmmeMemoRadiSam system radical SAM enzyme [Candidatus Woesearchaeota archaeon]|nr:AmmeMemoRadiSam system radical SAM enzyme [Candidatus Woesearchaeota archaeon]
MKEAVLYTQEKNIVKCTACKWYCKIPEGKTGLCAVRGNVKGKLQLMVYGKVCSMHVDPIEKKPLYHFLPGTDIFSIGTVGCNFSCDFCQNWTISQTPKHDKMKNISNQFENIMKLIKKSHDLSPEEAVSLCVERNISSIAYTYNEPTIFIEYAHDTAKLGKEKGLKNVFVSSGYETKEAMEYIGKYLDAMNIDLKAFKEESYKKVCHTHLQPVLETIEAVAKEKIWLEITTLVIPGFNDSAEELKDIASFIAGLDKKIPWHVTAFHPEYKMMNNPPTTAKALVKARKIGKDAGLRYVYTGNIPGMDYESTFCPQCEHIVIKRFGMGVEENRLRDGKCWNCNEKIDGVF